MATAWVCSAVGVGHQASCSPGGDLVSLWGGMSGWEEHSIERTMGNSPGEASEFNQGVSANRRPEVCMERAAQR